MSGKISIVFALGAFAAAAVNAADPYVGYIYPSALEIGVTNRLVIGGQYLWAVNDAWVSGEGVEVVEVKPVPGFPFPDGRQRQYLKDWVLAIERGTNCVPEMPKLKPTDAWRTNKWWMALNELGTVERRIVAKDLWKVRNPLQAAPSLQQLAVVSVWVNPKVKPGRRQLRLVRPDAMSEPRPLDIVEDRIFRRAYYLPPKIKEGFDVLDVPCTVTGTVMPGATDTIKLRLKKGMRFMAKVTGRDYQPYIGDAVPGFFNPVVRLVDAKDREIAFADDSNRMNSDPVLECTIPDSGEYKFKISDRLFRGREDFVYTIHFGEAKGEGKAKNLGECRRPNQKIITITSPQILHYDVFARREGSPMDPRLVIENSAGSTLAVYDDVTNSVHFGTVIQEELDPRGEHYFSAPGRYCLRVEDTLGRTNLPYRLEVRKPRPSFEVYTEKSAIALAPGERKPLMVRIDRREGFAGSVTLVENEWLRFENAVIPANTNVAKVVVVGKKNIRNHRPVEIEILAVGVNDADGSIAATRVVACDAYDQAFAWNHLVSFGKFVFKCRFLKPKPQKSKAQNSKSQRKKK